MNLYKKAIAKWGKDAQLDMLAEECAELSAAVMRFKRRRADSFTNLFQEIADVEYMCYCLKINESEFWGKYGYKNR